MPDDANLASANLQPHSIESRASWVAAGVTLAILSVAYGAPLLIVVGLRAMELDLGISRSILALAGAMTWIGTGLGGIVMGWLADRIGVRNSVLMGTVMVASGLALSSTGHVWALYVGHGVLIGFLGMGAIYPPLLIYVSRWFDRKRGTAIALISSGQYVAGVVWPAVFERLIAGHGWRITYLGYAGVVLLGMLPLAALFLHPVPDVFGTGGRRTGSGHMVTPASRARVLGLRPNVVQAIICAASVCCCVPMAIPQAHLVAFCGDIGIGAATGATMLSVFLGCAFISRQFWGAFADRYGGLKTVLAGSAFQAVSIGAFLLTRTRLGCSLSRPPTDWAFRRHHSRLRGGDPRPVPVRRGVLAHPTGAVHRDERNGIRQLVRRGPSSIISASTAGLRLWRDVQHRQSGAGRAFSCFASRYAGGSSAIRFLSRYQTRSLNRKTTSIVN